MQLMRRAILLAIVAVAALGGRARAQVEGGDVSVRAVYYKEHSTRVEQPMIDARLDLGDGQQVDAHFLVDAITSASPGSGAVGIPFTERRYEAGGGYLKALRDLPMRLGALVRGSIEPDYESAFAGGHVEYDLADKNFTLAATIGGGRDHITNAGAQGPFVAAISEHLNDGLASFSASQILSKNTVASLTYDLAYYHGYLANPYRSVITADGLEPERVPPTRWRNAFAAIVRHYVPETATTLIGSYRYYIDDWGVRSHTPELRFIQQAGEDMTFGGGFRYYHQRAASFFLPVYPSADPMIEPWLTDDPKLSAFTGETMTATFGVAGHAFGLDGRWSAAHLDVIIEYVVQHNRFGNAGIGHVALTVPFGD
jgi:hypothetical protein